MGFGVVNSALMQCSFGNVSAPLTVLPVKQTLCCNMPAATIMDNIPLVNIPAFGMCQSLANPTVASATAAALGTLTPMPCIPMTLSPWSPGNTTVLIQNNPALSDSSKLICNWGGIISINFAGQITVQY